ncbi:MAG: hypothetical protein DRI57_20355 [Deltaproteobacteria bacterium]|nr:MAG: hypothetical protein DRI57_20355 [Deltaproteobacteria bacterium]
MFGMFGISDSGQLSEYLSEFGVGSDLENSRSPNRFPAWDGRCGHRFLSENFRRKILFYSICGLCAVHVPEYDVCLLLPFS